MFQQTDVNFNSTLRPAGMKVSLLQRLRGNHGWFGWKRYHTTKALPTPPTSRLHYRIIAADGEVMSIQSSGTDDIFLGHINLAEIPAPYNATNIMQSIREKEKIDGAATFSLQDTSVDDTAILKVHADVSLLAPNGPGSTPQNPLKLFMRYDGKGRSKNMRARQQSSALVVIIAQADSNYPANNPMWLPHRYGETLYTDNVLRFLGPNNTRVLWARNISGQSGYVLRSHVQ